VGPALVVALAERSNHLTERSITLPQAAAEGGSLLVWIVVIALCAGLIAVAFRLVAARTHLSVRAHRIIGGIALGGVVLAGVASVAAYGAPWTVAHRAVDSFRGATKQVSGPNETGRLFDLSSNGRVTQWRVSIDQFREHPVVGDGAGSYAAAWALRRPVESEVKDSHSLYVEVLGELGIVGLVIVILALAAPLVAAVRARRQPLAVGAFATYAAFLAHAAVDWDWELAGVTLVGLMAAVALVVTARGDDENVAPRTMTRIGLPVVTGVLALLALAAVLSTVPLNQSRIAYNRLDFVEAASKAQKASDWAPWSSEALDMLGRSQLAEGKMLEARTSLASAVAKSPNDWELWRDLAAASRPAQARAATRRALALNPLESELRRLQDALAPKKS